MKKITTKPKTKPEKAAAPMPVRKRRGSGVSTAKFSDAEREVIKNHCARLYLEGYSNYGMSLWLKENTEWTVSQPTIRTYIDDILDDWHAQRIDDVDKAITGQLQKLQRMEQEAWDAWERSKSPQMRKVSKKKGVPTKSVNGETPRIAVTATEFEDVEETTESVGDFRFLDLFNRVVMQRLQLLTTGGFNKPDDPGAYAGNKYVQNIVYVEVAQRYPPGLQGKEININPVN